MSSSPSPALPATFKRVHVPEAKGPFTMIDVPLKAPGAKEVVIRIEACGVCHSDMFCKMGFWHGLQYPRVPGHEIAGVVVSAGSEVKDFKVGDHVGKGWHGYHCGLCDQCKRGNFLKCQEEKITGLTTDGGYQQYLTTTTESLAILPKELPFVEAGPLMCAGVTVFNALRRCGAIAPAVVAVQGVGGLGHLAIQFAAKLGFEVVAISQSDDKKELAHKLGAKHYLNATKVDANAEIQKLGGARVLILTAYDADAATKLMGCLGFEGVALGLGADQKLTQISSIQFIGGNNRYQGWASGTQADSADTAKFAEYTGVKPMVETFPLDKAQEAYDRMMSNKAKFRVVIEPQKLSK